MTTHNFVNPIILWVDSKSADDRIRAAIKNPGSALQGQVGANETELSPDSVLENES
jgi:hypothetical protein